MNIDIDAVQQKALSKLKTGSILCGGVGSGKSRVGIAHYFMNVCGGVLTINGEGTYSPMKTPKDLYVITTARKRDDKDWEKECYPACISVDREHSVSNVKLAVDSWNNIAKYTAVKDAMFIFDEQRVVGTGSWVKAFYKIAKKNDWILLTATPGDVWKDYIPVFVANGFFRNKTHFNSEHVIFNSFTKYPKIDRYVGQGKLLKLRKDILVVMPVKKHTTQHHHVMPVQHDPIIFSKVFKDRWNVFKDEPIKESGELCYLLRRVVNCDASRLEVTSTLLQKHPRLVIFYNFDYELFALREFLTEQEVVYSEWNGHKHQPVPKSLRWAYLVQYTAGAEAWECTSTDAMLFFSQTYSYKVLTQAAGRIDRRNTKFIDLHYYHLISNSQIDCDIRLAINNKETFNEKIYE